MQVSSGVENWAIESNRLEVILGIKPGSLGVPIYHKYLPVFEVPLNASCQNQFVHLIHQQKTPIIIYKQKYNNYTPQANV